MRLFQAKKIQSIIALIIVLVCILWIFQDNFFKVYALKKSNDQMQNIDDDNKAKPYLEKIENFAMDEYSNDEKILYTINADTYFSYKNSPIELINIIVKTFNQEQKEGAALTSNQAQILDTGEIVFNGNVNIQTINNVYHEVDSETLVFDSDNGEIKSDTTVFYKGERAKIKANGMFMNIDNDKLLLKDSVNINHESGSVIDSSELSINHSNGEKIYSSENKTLYRSDENKITANSGLIMDMNKNSINLLGKVTILQNSGTKINTSNLQIDNSDDEEIYQTDYPTEYISSQLNIKANKMYYDVTSKNIDLFGAVNAVYE